MINPKVSIIIPAYNSEKYIRNTLDSVLRQTYNNIEVIIVNDGSIDGTKDIIDEYALKDNRIKSIHKVNGGVTSARLRGISEAVGQYIGFVDADDYIEPVMYEKLVGNALKYDADISHCGYVMIFPSGRKVHYYNTNELRIQNNQKGLIDLIEGKLIEPSLLNKIFKKELFDSILNDGIMDLSIRINEDVLMNYYLFKSAKISVFEDVCLYHYLVRDGSAANSKMNHFKICDPVKVTKIILEDIKRLDNGYLLDLTERRLLHQLVYYITLDSEENKELIKPIQKKFYRELKQMCFDVMKDKKKTLSLKCKVLFTIISPKLYKRIHQLYKKIRGIDKIYDLEV